MDREPLLTRVIFPLAIWAAMRVGVDLTVDDLNALTDNALAIADLVVVSIGVVAARRRTRPLDATGAPI